MTFLQNWTSITRLCSLRSDTFICLDGPLVHLFSSFLGRPRGFREDPSDIASAVLRTHCSSPRGRPRATHTSTASAVASSIPSTHAAHRAGSVTGSSQSTTGLSFSAPVRIAKLLHAHCRLCLTSPARLGLLSTYRISVR